MTNKIIITLLLLNTSIVFGQSNNLISKLDSVVDSYSNVYGFSGATKVIINNKSVFEKSVGLANRSFGIKNTPNTRFSINSISKTFTATAILILVEDGKIELSTSIAKYIPELKTHWADSITIHHLLTHTSGLPRESGVQPNDNSTFKQQIKLIEKQNLLFPAGHRFEYSNAGVTLLGAIIENVSGLSYQKFIDNKIISPLKLDNTGYYSGKKIVANSAVAYRITSNGLEFAQRSKHYGDNAGGGLYSNTSDLFKFIKGLESHKILSKKFVDLMFQSHVESGKNEFEGYAWSIKYFGDEKIHFAAGSGYGTKSVIIRMPASGDYIGITSNWGNTPILQLLRDLYLTIRGKNVPLPSKDELANPSEYERYIGTYIFKKEELTKHLGIESDSLNLQQIDGRLFLDDELLAAQKGILSLTYTNELSIRFKHDKMIININGNMIEGTKVLSKK